MTTDVIVVGLGHAGIEAALAAARLGRHVAAVIPDPARIGWMSCNPAIGGSAKSQLVRELDALGGEMARAADAAGIQFRRLNASRGPAVHATRVLCDRVAYAAEMGRRVRGQANLELVADSVVGLDRRGGRVTGVHLASGRTLAGKAVVLTTGTFLAGVLHTGAATRAGGRVGEAPARGISEDLAALGLRLGRFKTGTPPRLWAQSIDFTLLTPQSGDDPPRPLSFWTNSQQFPMLPQRSCWLTHTTAATHDLVRRNLDRSPLYQGRLRGQGPRYCPSLEDKVVRFADRERHQVFLEPEGVDAPWVYPAGLSTSLPPEVQLAMVRTIPGLEAVEIAQPGYAVEYDHVPATQLDRRLAVGETGLFLAGQVNGTSGYEEAAVQGLWAGINAARAVAGEAPWGLSRSQAFAAVLVDELTGKPQGEPFRMFTSRSEHRLALREGNADLRLAGEGRALGLLDARRAAQVDERRRRIEQAVTRLRATRANPDRVTREALREAGMGGLEGPTTLSVLLARPEASWAKLTEAFPALVGLLRPDEAEEVEAEVRYAGYLQREAGARRRVAALGNWIIPQDFVYLGLAGLSREAQDRLSAARPATLEAAGQVPGVPAAALGVLAVHLARWQATGGCE